MRFLKKLFNFDSDITKDQRIIVPEPVVSYAVCGEWKICLRKNNQEIENVWQQIFKDYNTALSYSVKRVEEIHNSLASAGESETVFIFDTVIKKSDFLRAYAVDPYLVIYHDNNEVSNKNIEVFVGSNLAIVTNDVGQEKLAGDYKLYNRG